LGCRLLSNFERTFFGLFLHLFLEVGLVFAQLLLADDVGVAASVHGRRRSAVCERISSICN
jgi:hypothetical protein